MCITHVTHMVHVREDPFFLIFFSYIYTYKHTKNNVYEYICITNLNKYSLWHAHAKTTNSMLATIQNLTSSKSVDYRKIILLASYYRLFSVTLYKINFQKL